MEIVNQYLTHFKSALKGRYITFEHIEPLLKKSPRVEILKYGVSEKGKNIPLLKIGNGSHKVLAWSQMHGNESTTTKAVFDFLKLIEQEKVYQNEILKFLDQNTLFLIPMLNPDGAELYTRNNANNIDLNRDAKQLTQKESSFLDAVFTEVTPDLCLNLHDQRTIYGLNTSKPATVSFLSPAANASRSVTPARKKAMNYIVAMNNLLQDLIPDQVGRYDDTFNSNCVGDRFTSLGVPTILFEAGHYPDDYQREKTREFIFYALLNVFGILKPDTASQTSYDEYFNIPENQKNYCDILLQNVQVKPGVYISIAIQYEEVLSEKSIDFIPVIKELSPKEHLLAHKIIDIGKEMILINSQENIYIDDKIYTICYKNTGKEIIL